MLRKMYKFIILAAASITALKGQTFQLAPQIVEIGSVFTMNCLTAIDDPIAFLLNDTTKGSCPAPFGVPQPCDPTDIAQDQATTNTSWTITATSSHNGTWKCKKGLDPPSNSINLQTYLCAKTTLSENGINSDLELNETSSVNITFQTGCIYPSNNPEIILQFKSGTQEINSVLNCVESETACTDGTAFECTNHISYGMSLMNGQFSFKRNYTLHFKVSTTVRDCSSIAIFDQYLLSFIQTGHDSTTQEPLSTEQSQVDVSTSFTDSPYSSTKHSGNGNTETIISTDMYITTYNSSTVPEGQNLLVHLVIPVSVGSVCLVVITGVIICYVNYKRHENSKKASGMYTDPETTSHEEHVYQRRSATNQERCQIKNTEKSSLQSRFSQNEFSPKLFHDEYIYTRRNLQHDRYEKDFNNDNRLDRRLHPTEMAYLPHGYYRNEQYTFAPQTSRSAVLNDYHYYNQRRKMMHQRDHNFISNFTFYRG